MTGTTELHIDGPVASIVFNRPDARNAMTWTMYEELEKACLAIENNSSIRVVSLRGAGGKAFISGTDIAQFSDFKTGSDGVLYEKQITKYVGAVANLSVPTIGIIEGWAVGGGMAIASVCDFRIATPGTRFGVPIAKTLGNCLSAANLGVLVSTLGLPMVKRMLLLAEMINAEEMIESGYVHAIVEVESLEDQVSDMVDRLIHNAPITLLATKKLLNRINDYLIKDEDLIAQVYGSNDFHEGVDAFINKRSPEWKGK
ncbi:MAG TPA: enoyl-CoA hydratase [Gammaproteobacteria bacterium]|nr:enoyl-CoA hydratase [Gammaproteobacteria bacterium]|tara:strand:- start:207 stop:977 length:771 start_codon:yes stop_codon:yes gene_type:complete